MSQWPVRLILLAATTGILLPYCFPRYDLGLLAWGEIAPCGGEPEFHNYTYPLIVLST